MEEKLRVMETLDVYLPDVDGVINCMHNYCLNMNDKTDLTVMVPKNKRGYKDNEPYKILRCKSIYIPFLGYHYGFPNFDKKFKQYANEHDFDIIHVHSPFNMANFALKLGKKKNIPVVATFHSNFRQDFKSVLKSKALTERVLKHFGNIYNKFDEVFVCSPQVEEMLRSFGFNKKVTYLPLGTEFEKCEVVDENIKRANEELKIGEDELVFIYVGRLMPNKRVNFIIDGLKIVKDKGVKFRFYVVGKGPMLEKLKKQTKKLGFDENEIIFTGFIPREHFPLLFSRADLLLFPSLYDTFGLVKVEGAAYCTPGVFVENSCAGAQIKHGENGFLCKNNVEDFANVVIEAVKDRQKLKEIGKNAQDTLYIHWRDCSEVLLDNLKRVVNEYKEKHKTAKNE